GDVLGLRQGFAKRVRIEVAVRAFAHAPGHVHVQRKRRSLQERALHGGPAGEHRGPHECRPAAAHYLAAAVPFSTAVRAIQSRTCFSSTSSGTAPFDSTTSWKSRMSNFGPRRVSASVRSCWMRSCPILYA